MLSVIEDPGELENLRKEWSELWRNDPRATPFQSPEWLLPWWRHLFGGGLLWTIAQWREGRLVSLFPLFRYGAECERVAFLGAGVSDYLDLLGEPVEEVPGDWANLTLEELRPDSPLLGIGRAEPCSVCPVISLPASMSELKSRIDPKLAVDIHRSSNRLSRAGSVSIERTGDPTDLFKLHEARWVERAGGGVLTEARLQAFHREVVAGFARLGILRLYNLHLDGQPAASVYAFTHRRRTYAYLSGFNPELSKLSPGTVLLAHVIEQSILDGAREFDFLRNREGYKYKWAASDQPTYKIVVTKPGPDLNARD